ncbi:MAG: glycosyl transferase [Synechocystis sp.]|nr:glycosyl transferase [Synechocystis sp.]
MKRPTLYCAITGHGFGHAVRMACIAHRVQQLCPEVLIIMATRSPRWLLESYLEKPFIHRPVAVDVGVIQADSLQMDTAATLARLTEIYQQKHRLIATESNYLRNNQVDLVLADIPPLAVAIAHQAGVPAWCVSNFGWNFIYRDWGEPFGEIVAKMEADYAQADLLFRLPLAEPMAVFPNQIEAGLTGGDPRFTEQDLRQTLGIHTPKDHTILLTFGGLGLQAIPYDGLKAFPDWQFLTFDRQAPPLPNLTLVPGQVYRPVDIMPICGRVMSKPGFSTFSEALRLEVPIISLTREGFAEAAILLDGLQNYGDHQIIDHQDFFAGNWDFLNHPPNPPRLSQKLDKNGDRQIAEKILAQIS